MVEIVEVGPRDGLQNESAVLAAARRAQFIERMADAGARRIEAVSFVHADRVPQMADAEEVLTSLPALPGVSLVGLVLNRRGYDRAAATRLNEVNFVVLASETFNRRNQGRDILGTIGEIRSVVAEASKSGLRLSLTISAAFGCPFEGEISETQVLRVLERFDDVSFYEIALADTIGVAAPAAVVALGRSVRAERPDARLRGHFHNTRNTGMANAHAAVEAGFDAIDASLGGIGGCPFAPNAAGNIPTEDLVYMLERNGVSTGFSMDALLDTAAWLERELGHELPGMVRRAGRFPAGDRVGQARPRACVA